MLKAEARKLFKQKREALSAKEKQLKDDLLLIQFQQLKLGPLQSVFSYAAVEAWKEISTDLILDFLEFRNPEIKIAYSVYDHSLGQMEAVWVNEETLFKVNNRGISEPEGGEIADPRELELILVPLLAFDKLGNRVGYGKGVYDKFFKKTAKDAIKVGLSYFDPVPKIEDTNEFDVSLNYCITPQRIYEF